MQFIFSLLSYSELKTKMASNNIDMSVEATGVDKYKMDHKKRGIALIINILNYNPNPFELKKREWSIKDVEKLIKTLKYLEFQVVLCQDFTKSEIEQVMLEQASINHSESDCFLCVVMSHGNADKITASDSENIKFEEIMAPIKECETLRNKPKLFFFQACRGENEMEKRTIPHAEPSRPDSAESKSIEQITYDNNQHRNTNNNDSHSFKTNKKTLIDTEADLLVYNATLPKHYAYGTVSMGTYFIQSVCDVFFTEAFKSLPNSASLSQMITMVNSRVKGTEIMLADPINRLTKEVYFTPKNVSVSRSIYMGCLYFEFVS
jgi:caspase 7